MLKTFGLINPFGNKVPLILQAGSPPSEGEVVVDLKLLKLEKEHEKWLKEFQANRKIIPGIKQLLTIRIDG